MSEYGRLIQMILIIWCVISLLGTKFGGVILTSQEIGIVWMILLTNTAAMMRK